MITTPAETCPLPVPPDERGQLVLSLPATDHPAIRRALGRLIAAQEVWLTPTGWTFAQDAPARVFTRQVALVYEETTPIWELRIAPWHGSVPAHFPPHVRRLSDVLAPSDLDTWKTQPPEPLYGGCQSIIIRRTQLERLCMIAEQTLFGRFRDGYQTLLNRRCRVGRTAAREAAQTQLDALVTIHDQLPNTNITHAPPTGHQMALEER